jgi:hypothetical protein
MFEELRQPAARVATRHLIAYFKPGEYILYGKFKNKRGKIVRMFLDSSGIFYIEIEPVPKGRKSNRIMGLYTIRKLPAAAVPETKALDKLASESQRVVMRFAGTEVRPVADYIRDFTEARPAIERAIEEGDIPTARRLFVRLGEMLEPLATMFEGVRFERQDEQRKMKNVLSWLRRLQYPFESRYVNQEDGETRAWINLSLDSIAETLASLRRVQNRLQEYTEVEKEFRHGPFQIVNKYGYRSSEYAESLAVLDTAADRLKSKGFGKALYGKVELVGAKSGKGFAGKYVESADLLKLNVESRKRFDDLHTLVHELGHRWWNKMLSAAQRDAYEDAYSGKGIDLKGRQDMFQALVKAQFSPRRAVGFLSDPSLEAPFLAWVSYVFGNQRQKDLVAAHERGEGWVEKNFVRPKQRYVSPDNNASVETVSAYAKTNVSEDFAETFAFFVLGKPMPDQVQIRWRLVT